MQLVLAMPGQLGLHRLIASQMRSHQAFPETTMIRHEEMQQLMDDYIVPERFIKPKQISIEVQMAVRGTGGPLVTHRPDAQPGHLHFQLVGPVVYPSLECALLCLLPFH